MSASKSFNRNDGGSIVALGNCTVRFVHVIATESVKILGESESNGLRSQHISIESEPGIDLDATLHVPSGSGQKPAVLLLAGRPFHQLSEKMWYAREDSNL
jgi:hypothetical protein